MPAAHQTILQLYDGDDPIGIHILKTAHLTPNSTTYPVQLGELDDMAEQRRRERRRTSDGPRLIQRLLDPDRDHPILRKLIQTIAPIAIAFLTQKLPTWLSGLDLQGILEPDHDEET